MYGCRFVPIDFPSSGESKGKIVFCCDRRGHSAGHQSEGKIYSTPKRFKAFLALAFPLSAAIRYQLMAWALSLVTPSPFS